MIKDHNLRKSCLDVLLRVATAINIHFSAQNMCFSFSIICIGIEYNIVNILKHYNQLTKEFLKSINTGKYGETTNGHDLRKSCFSLLLRTRILLRIHLSVHYKSIIIFPNNFYKYNNSVNVIKIYNQFK